MSSMFGASCAGVGVSSQSVHICAQHVELQLEDGGASGPPEAALDAHQLLFYDIRPPFYSSEKMLQFIGL